MKSKCYDVIVVGGGLAGSTAACRLARLGKNVLVIEKEAGAHHKVCGEFLSPETLPYLQDIGVDVNSLGASLVTGLTLHAPHSHIVSHFAEPARGLSRFVLDAACLAAAECAGAKVLRGVTVRDIKYEAMPVLPNGFCITTSIGDFFCRAVFLATGKHEIRQVQNRDSRDNGAIGFKIHVRLSSVARKILGSHVALYFYAGGYAGLCAVENDIVNLSFIVDRDVYKRVGRDFGTCLDFMRGHNTGLREILDGVEFAWSKPLSVAPVPYGYVRRVGTSVAGLYCLGDQFAVIPSLSGTGMAIALLTAKRAAKYFHSEDAAGVIRYDRECEKIISRRMRVSYPVHWIFRRPFFAEVCARGLKPFPRFTAKLIEKMRLPVL